MPIVSPYAIHTLIRIASNGLSTGKQALDGQEVSQRGAEIRWIVQYEGPLSRESPTSRLRCPVFRSVSKLSTRLFLPLVSIS